MAPALVHYPSNRDDAFRAVLPLLAEAEKDECVLVVESPLSEIVDRTIWLNRHPDFPDRAVIDKRQQPFFDAVRASLQQALAKLDEVEFAPLDDEGEDN